MPYARDPRLWLPVCCGRGRRVDYARGKRLSSRGTRRRTSMSNGTFTAELRGWTSGWWLLLLVGTLSVIAGVIILFKPSDSLATLAVIAGIFVLVDGLVELIASFSRQTQSRGFVAVLGV